jgi:hypothetical protein
MLSKARVLQTIKEGKIGLGIEDAVFEVECTEKPDGLVRRAEIFIWSKKRAKIVLYPSATLFSVHHELCHMKLFRMGIPLTNTEKDSELFPAPEDYLRMVVIVEWYINELQKRVFKEYYAIDNEGTPRPPPFIGLPELPKKKFSRKQIEIITEMVKKSESLTSKFRGSYARTAA